MTSESLTSQKGERAYHISGDDRVGICVFPSLLNSPSTLPVHGLVKEVVAHLEIPGKSS